MRTVSPGGSARACRRRSSRRSGGGSADAGSSPACWIRNSSRNRSSSAGDQAATDPARRSASASIRRSTPPGSPSAIRSTRSDERLLGHEPEQPRGLVGRDLAVRHGRELVERADGIAERAAGRAGDQVQRGVGRLDLLGVRDPRGAPWRARRGPGAGTRSAGSASAPSAAACPRRSCRGRTRPCPVAPRASSAARSTRPRSASGPRRGCRSCDRPRSARAMRARSRSRGSCRCRGCEAASSSITSSERASWIAMQRSQVPSGVGGRPVLAVQRLREDLGERGLAGAARAGEQVGMRDAILLDRGLQGAHDMFLAHDVGERAWAVLAIERRHRHRV